MFTYEEIIGNEGIVEHIKHSIAYGNVSHAYIFHGQAGSGKKTIAKTFAKALQCTGEGSAPCNRCTSCRTFESGNHPDIQYVTATKTKALGVEDVREQINDTIGIKPYRYPHKVYIIHKADTMTVSAQNALLKTIEEPPDYGVFMLLADNADAFLPTIISRCIQFKLQSLSNEQIEAYLVSHLSIAPEKASFFSAYAQGNIGRARALAVDEDFIALRQAVLALAQNIRQKEETKDLVGLFALAKEFERYKDKIQEVLDILIIWYRDLLVQNVRAGRFLIQKDKEPLLVQQAGEVSVRNLLSKLEALFRAKRQLVQNGNFQMVIENMLLS